MNNEKVLHVVNDVIIDRLTQLIEDMSTNEFVDMIVDKLGVEGIEVETDEEREEVTNLIGSRVIPLLHKITEYGVGKNIPTD
jgi:hypothetical protein